MKILTALLLLISLALPAGVVTQAMAVPAQEVCAVTDDTGSACCAPAVTHCCCATAPAHPATPAPTLPAPVSPDAAKGIAAALPNLLIHAELPRLSDSPVKSAPFSDRAPFATAPPVRFCVLRCSLLI